VRYVLAGLPQTSPQESVDDLLDGEGLEILHDLYLRIVNYAIPLAASGDRHAQGSHDQTMKILSTILLLPEPLDSQSLADLLELDKTVLLRTLFPLSAVIYVSDTPREAIRIVHPSFREFMMSYVQVNRPDILCGTDDQRQALVSALAKVSHRQLKFDPSTADATKDRERLVEIRRLLESLSFFGYCSLINDYFSSLNGQPMMLWV
jgi:hypothetical protein